jgi:DnaJ-class molecular chaperone
VVTRREAILLLGVAPGADEAEVRAAFRKKVREQHPDTARAGADPSNVHRLIDAYRLLVDTGFQTGPVGSVSQQVPVNDCSAERSSSSFTTRRTCPRCRGAGFGYVLWICPVCRGQGHLTTLYLDRLHYCRCPRCRGSGHVPSADRCQACDGTGLRVASAPDPLSATEER